MNGSSAEVIEGTLPGFCDSLCGRYDSPQHESLEVIADDFRAYFGLAAPTSARSLYSLCDRMGLHLPISHPLPSTLRGMHVKVGDTYQIICKEADSERGLRHTILHEIWEILQDGLRERNPHEKPPWDQEARARRFAAAVQMPRERFREDCIRMSYDPLLLEDKHDQSCHSVLLRMRDLLGSETAFIGLTYIRIRLSQIEHDPKWVRYLDSLKRESSDKLPYYLLLYRVHGFDFPEKCEQPIPDLHESASGPGFFNAVAAHAIDMGDSTAYYRVHYAEGDLVLAASVDTAEDGHVRKVTLTGILERDWDRLRQSVTRSPVSSTVFVEGPHISETLGSVWRPHAIGYD